jgi:DNA-binding transcriptional MerR regulator/quercetin dioxygenase-like cupin family protein
VARQIGVVPATVRNWEKAGLFTARRTDKGYRVYDVGDIERLRRIRELSKDKSMGLNAIRLLQSQPDEQTVPAGPASAEVMVSKKLLGRKWREYRLERGYLLEEVARAVGISVSYLSKIENVQANVSYAVLKRLAEFYGENILYYVAEPEKDQALVKKNEGEVLSIGLDGVTIESVVARRHHTLSGMVYTVAPGCGRQTPNSHNGEEFVHVLKGEIRMDLDGREFCLKSGDSLNFQSRETHCWLNTGKFAARILWVYTPLTRN